VIVITLLLSFTAVAPEQVCALLWLLAIRIKAAVKAIVRVFLIMAWSLYHALLESLENWGIERVNMRHCINFLFTGGKDSRAGIWLLPSPVTLLTVAGRMRDGDI
jgi:hypothetical protein